MLRKYTPKLLVEERRRAILDRLGKDGRVKVEDLSHLFSVSTVTVREDLETLAERGLLVRSHGGAIQPLDPVKDYPLPLKKRIHQPEKTRIARKAAQLIGPSQTVILDSGTTATELAVELQRTPPEGLTVITHSLDVAQTLATAPSISVVQLGGVLRHISHSCVGPQAENMLMNLHADHFFLAVDGFDLQAGLSTPDVLEAQLNASMIRVSREVTVIADASKFGRRSMSMIAPLSSVKRVITDEQVEASFVQELRQRGIEVILA